MTYLMLPELGRQMAMEPTFDPKEQRSISRIASTGGIYE
jgi:hypothetical protein